MFGPTPRDYSYKMNAQEKKAALKSALSQRELIPSNRNPLLIPQIGATDVVVIAQIVRCSTQNQLTGLDQISAIGQVERQRFFAVVSRFGLRCGGRLD